MPKFFISRLSSAIKFNKKPASFSAAQLIFIWFFFIFFNFSYCFAARDYKPVDELGHSSYQTKSSQKQEQSKTQGSKAAQARSIHGAEKAGTSSLARDGNHLFGTVELKRPLNTLPGWLDVLKRNSADLIFIPQKMFNRKTGWVELQSMVNGKSPREQLRIVNSFWNGWPYQEDISNWGREDYWEIPAEFLRKSGDCEDYAITKYFTLKELGFPPENMRIVVLRDTVRNLAHAVLAVYLDNDIFILDNLSSAVLSHQRISNYNPQYSVNEKGRWAHLKPKGK